LSPTNFPGHLAAEVNVETDAKRFSDADGARRDMPFRGAALAGVLFAALMGGCLVIVRVAVPVHPGHPGTWLTDPWRREAVRLAVNIAPFAGIAFLWFIGVLRSRLGAMEDRFFASVFLGSGLLFVASLYASAAFSAALVESIANDRRDLLSSDSYYLARYLAGVFLNVFAVKMAGVFMISTSSIALRTGIIPRTLAFSGYGCAAVLLLVLTSWPWIALVFPAWILAVSIYFITAGEKTCAGYPARTPAEY
jgi:hypothetical protein